MAFVPKPKTYDLEDSDDDCEEEEVKEDNTIEVEEVVSVVKTATLIKKVKNYMILRA